jgi:hypothetical protein
MEWLSSAAPENMGNKAALFTGTRELAQIAYQFDMIASNIN